jgi:long-subunit acyl-CoA synthetase (AMP-forming)
VPELEYYSTDLPHPRGEIQVKGTSIITGYFKNKEKTIELFDEEGWLNTGDAGVILENGSIKITDRAKNIFKLS